ncbi:MAG: hypothetical protein Q8Q76_13765 [Methylotenera sp.]|nr:hypothetical protein [Methylotenera sp.]
MKKKLQNRIKVSLQLLAAALFLVIVIPVALVIKFRHQKKILPRLVWGSTPIISYSHWSRAMQQAGYTSQTFTNGFYSSINNKDDWDILLQDKYKYIPHILKYYLAFIESLFRYDVFFMSFDGFFLGLTPLWKLEFHLLRIAGKKTVLMPYGSDSYVYRSIKSTALNHALLMSYPKASMRQEQVAKRVSYWCMHADVVITGIMGPDGFGRWDTIVPSVIHLDTNIWKASSNVSKADGKTETVFIAHAPNHRGFKGTEFVLDAVEKLRSEGLKVELILLEKMKNEVVRKTLQTKIDILVEQLIFGHGLNALEGMASGIPVISNVDDDDYILPFRRWSYFSECPLVSASPETIVDVLRKLVTRPELRHQLGKASRAYVEKYHGLDSAQYLFTEVIEYCYGRRESLINLYHPLLGEYPKRKPKVIHPLVNNRIID